MKADYVRQGVATFLAVGFLTVGALSQDGAQGDVNIKDEAATKAPTTASVKPSPKSPRPAVVDRDPFINLLTGGLSSSSARSRPLKSAGGDDGDIEGADADADADGASADDSGDFGDDEGLDIEEIPEVIEEVIEIPEPNVVVKGIVSSGSGRQAILLADSGTFVVTPGQVLGDFRVSSIGVDYVTLYAPEGAHSFKIPLENPFPGQP